MIRSDNTSAVTHEMRRSRGRALNDSYAELLDHYGLESTLINAGESHENGVAEQAHYRLKDAIDQALMLRGSRDLIFLDEYGDFVRKVVDRRNRLVMGKLEEERPHLQLLPSAPVPEYVNHRARVRKWSAIQAAGRTYTVPSRLILVQSLLSDTPDVRLVSGVGDGSVACGVVIPLVQAQVLDAFRPLHHYALQRRPEQFRVVDISSGHHHAQWPAGPVDQDAFLASSLAPVRGIASNGAPQNAPFPWSNRRTAINLRRPTPVYAVQLPSTPSNSRHSSIRAAQIPSITPRSTQRWKVRWMALSSPNSLGKRFHWQELRIRKMTPSSIFRWFTRLRPFALEGSNSKITGSIRCHRSSGIPQIVGRDSLFPIIYHHTGFSYLTPTAFGLSFSDQYHFEIVT